MRPSLILGTVVSVAILCTVISSLKGEEPQVGPFAQLKSEREPERQAAVEAIVTYRNDAINAAEQIIEEFGQHEDRKGTVKASILLLGKLQSQRSVPLLLDYLTFEVFYKASKRTQSVEDRFPAVQALVDIGLPSVDPVIDRIEKSKDGTVLVCAAKVLIGILGKDRAIEYVKQKLASEGDPLRKQRLSDLIAAVQ